MNSITSLVCNRFDVWWSSSRYTWQYGTESVAAVSSRSGSRGSKALMRSQVLIGVLRELYYRERFYSCLFLILCGGCSTVIMWSVCAVPLRYHHRVGVSSSVSVNCSLQTFCKCKFSKIFTFYVTSSSEASWGSAYWWLSIFGTEDSGLPTNSALRTFSSHRNVHAKIID